METAIVSLICIVLVIFGGMTMSQGFLTSVDSSTLGLEGLSERDEAIMRTEITPLSTSQPSSNYLDVTLRNTGQTKLADFDKWDVIVQYYDSEGTYYIKWLPYTEGTLGDNEWEKTGIYLDADADTAEVFEPDILNLGEEIKIEAKLNPAVGAGTNNLVIVSTPNGISSSISFSP